MRATDLSYSFQHPILYHLSKTDSVFCTNCLASSQPQQRQYCFFERRLWSYARMAPDMQVLRSLPRFQQTSAKALKLLETEVQSDMSHLTVTSQTEQSASWQRLTVNFLLLLGRMADNYQLERDAFLHKLATSRGMEGGREYAAVVHSPESPALEQPNKRHRSGMVCF